MCYPPKPELKLQQDKLKQVKLKQVKKVTFDMNVSIFSLPDNNKSKPAISNELLINAVVNNLYKDKLDQALQKIETLENEIQESKQRENELKEIIYNLKKIMDGLLMSRRESLINILPNVIALSRTTV